MKATARGFTIVELMITLVIAALVLAMAAPSFTAFRQNNRLTRVANDFLGAVLTARTEAIKRQLPVSVCPSSNPTDAAATCTTGNFTGWIAFVDIDSTCTRTNAALPDATLETDAINLIRSGDPLDAQVIAQSNGNCISFAPTGFLQMIAGRPTASFVFFWDDQFDSPKCGPQPGADTQSRARMIELTNTGRARINRVLDEVAEGLTTAGVTCP